MPSDGKESTSAWMREGSAPSSAPLVQNATADVCVIGAGIAGLSVAYHLALEGQTVVVLDAGHVGGGQTGRTTAHLSNALDDRYAVIERVHGEAGARGAAESHSAAIARIERIAKDESIECDFERVNGYLFLSSDESEDLLEGERNAALRAGLIGVEYLPRSPIEGFETGPCLVFPRQAQCHPLKYLAGLAEAVVRRRGRIHGSTRVRSVAGGKTARVETDSGHVVTAQAVVVATNTPVNDLVAIHTKQAAYRTYAIAARITRGSVRKALLWDTNDPYHYVRVHPFDGSSDLLIIGGEDHKTGQADDEHEPARYSRLESWGRARCSTVGRVEFRWSGQVLETIDGLAFIGRNPADEPNVYVVTGDSGMGMTHGTIAGMLIGDLIMGRDNPWAALYDPSRKILRAVTDFARENLNVAAQYADWLTAGDVDSREQIQSGCGAVIRRGLSKVAVFRDEQGGFHECSAICPHLGCLVNWNTAERSWDCPCHGSRFDPYGVVLNGPVTSNLAPAGEGGGLGASGVGG